MTPGAATLPARAPGPAPGAAGVRAERAVLATLAAFVVALVVFALAPRGDASAPPALPVPGAWAGWVDSAARLHYDDGFYYLVIAGHVARGDGPTFDGLHPTSGFHPLWLLVLVPLAWMARGAAALLVASALVQALLLVLTACVAYRTLRAGATRLGALLGALLFVQFAFVHHVALSGLEWSLHALAALGAAWLWRRDFCAADAPRGSGPYARLGCVLALAFLARVDTLPLAACLGLALAWRRVGPRRLAVLALPPVLAVAGYAAVNRQLTGHAGPVSAAVKRDWSLALARQDPRFVAGGWTQAKLFQLAWPVGRQRRAFWWPLALGSVGFAAALAFETLRARRRGTGPPRALRPWAPFALFAWVQWLALALVYHDGYSYAPWYFVVQPWLTAVLAAAVADGVARIGSSADVPARLSAPVALACLAVAAFTLADLGLWRARSRPEDALATVARRVRAQVPAGARVGAWNAGQIAFLSGRAVVNLDGLVNSWDFFEHGRHDLCAYLRAAGVAYLADSFPEAGVEGLTGAAWACRDRLRLLWSQRTGPPERPRLSALYAFEPAP